MVDNMDDVNHSGNSSFASSNLEGFTIHGVYIASITRVTNY